MTVWSCMTILGFSNFKTQSFFCVKSLTRSHEKRVCADNGQPENQNAITNFFLPRPNAQPPSTIDCNPLHLLTSLYTNSRTPRPRAQGRGRNRNPQRMPSGPSLRGEAKTTNPKPQHHPHSPTQPPLCHLGDFTSPFTRKRKSSLDPV
jgi:hypothetical protein